MLKIYNSLHNKKEIFIPIDKNKVKIYLCGITADDECHIGHARTNVAFDVIIRYLRYKKYNVCFVRNITDIDDKIILKSLNKNQNISVFVKNNINNMYKYFDLLNISRPDIEPLVTSSMPDIIDMISVLIKKGFAYQKDNKDILFNLNKLKRYGKLSNNINKCNINNKSKYNSDFVLWKNSYNIKDMNYSNVNMISWHSPWGYGRPGWHIECSAISYKYLGSTIDIHCGGSDLKFPHHENEIAQSESYSDCKLSNYWLHTGILKINCQKMSKSFNNILTIRDVVKNYHPEVLRFFLLSKHYRSDIHFSMDMLHQSEITVNKLYSCLQFCDLSTDFPFDCNLYINKFENYMNNDFNTPQALSVIFNITKIIYKYKYNDIKKASQYAVLLKFLSNILGLLVSTANEYFEYSYNINVIDINKLIDKRSIMKNNKNYVDADKIRQCLIKHGIQLEDTPYGTIWKKIIQ